jgi:hypothetical protein
MSEHSTTVEFEIQFRLPGVLPNDWRYWSNCLNKKDAIETVNSQRENASQYEWRLYKWTTTAKGEVVKI